jgi:hypothetical protein
LAGCSIFKENDTIDQLIFLALIPIARNATSTLAHFRNWKLLSVVAWKMSCSLAELPTFALRPPEGSPACIRATARARKRLCGQPGLQEIQMQERLPMDLQEIRRMENRIGDIASTFLSILQRPQALQR